MKMLVPPTLAPGDSIAVCAVASPATTDAVQDGIALLEPHFRVVWNPPVNDSGRSYLARSDDGRLNDFNSGFAHPKIRALISTRGGYGTSRFIDALDYGYIAENPRWIVGCSDLTALHLALWDRLRMQTIHGPMVARLSACPAEDVDALLGLLQGAAPRFPDLASLGIAACTGDAAGPLLGGNLTVFAHMCGTIDPAAFAGAVLFIEDVNEPLYKVDRAMVQLKRSGILSRIAALVVGEFTVADKSVDYENALLQLLGAEIGPLGIPVAVGYPAAHGVRNFPFIHGAPVALTVNDARAELMYQ